MPEYKLTDKQRQELVLRALDGENITHLAREFEIHRVHAHRIVREEKARVVREKDWVNKVSKKMSKIS